MARINSRKYNTSIFSPSSTRSSTSSSGFTIVELLIVVVVIAILAAITVVSYNGVTNRAKESVKASDISTWKRKSELHKVINNIVCPENYSFVYGNPTLGTSDFCVMKYEAKNDGGIAKSQAAGTPWANITQPAAIAAASAVGGRLPTDAEWMTIAADVLSVKYNWSGAEVGSGFIYSGHNDNVPGGTLAASTDDTDGYSGTGNSETSGANQRRVLYLSSGDVIWDLPGNVHEWTSTVQAMSQVGVSGDAEFAWYEWTLGTLSLGNLPAASRPSTLASYVSPVTRASLSGVTGWSSSKGIGRINANYAGTISRAFIRGGHSSGGSYTGVLSLHLGLAPSYSDSNIGFRVAR